MDTLGKSLEELRAMVDAIPAEKWNAQQELTGRLNALGVPVETNDGVWSNRILPLPTENARIRITPRHVTSDEFQMVIETPHICSGDCYRDGNHLDEDCESGEYSKFWDVIREATTEEVLEAIRSYLLGILEGEQAQTRTIWGLVKTLPGEEEIDAIRRRAEDRLRKDRKMILPVAKLLGLLAEK